MRHSYNGGWIEVISGGKTYTEFLKPCAAPEARGALPEAVREEADAGVQLQVRLHHGRPQRLASLRDHSEGRACRVDVQSD